MINIIRLSNELGISDDNHVDNLTFDTVNRLRVIDLFYSENSIWEVLDYIGNNDSGPKNKNIITAKKWIIKHIAKNSHIKTLCQKPSDKLSQKDKNFIIKFLESMPREEPSYFDFAKDREFIDCLLRSF